jgi:2-hydroxychromene-2-carboxylate isomerase
MFCIVAFVILAILGIFSASNRTLAKEALDCVFRRVTLRPCNTGFDEKMKAKILGSVITRSETAAKVINKNFELLSWTFFILMVGSSIWAVRGVYLFYVTGSCNGLNQAAFCVFDPKGANNQVSGLASTCKVTPTTEKDLTLEGVNQSGFPVLNEGAKDKIVFIGCYHCDYTRKAYPLVMNLAKKSGASFTFMHYPVKESTDYMTKLGYCAHQQDPKKYWQMNDIFFEGDKSKLDDPAYVQQTLSDLGFDTEKIKTCVDSAQTEETVQKMLEEVVKTQFYGTPTVFINDQVLVGPKPYRVYAILLNGLFYWLK